MSDWEPTVRRILVCGGRDYSDEGRLDLVLRGIICPQDTVIHGAARGADSLADAWARKRGCTVQAFPADWRKHGKAAGRIRNQRMLDEGRPEIVVAFPGGRGTSHMIEIARAAFIEVVRVSP